MTLTRVVMIDIHAYADKQLAEEEAKRIRELIETSPEARTYYLTVMYQKNLLKSWWEKAESTLFGNMRNLQL